MYNSSYMSTYLIHYGIKGQQKGKRRYQYEDGTYTPEGKERYRQMRAAKGIENGEDRKNWKPKDAKHLSDEELSRRNTRLQREQQYKVLTTPEWKKDTVQFAKEAMKKILLTTAVTVVSKYMLQKYSDQWDAWFKPDKKDKAVKDLPKAACDIGASVLASASKHSTALRPYNPHLRPRGQF